MRRGPGQVENARCQIVPDRNPRAQDRPDIHHTRVQINTHLFVEDKSEEMRLNQRVCSESVCPTGCGLQYVMFLTVERPKRR